MAEPVDLPAAPLATGQAPAALGGSPVEVQLMGGAVLRGRFMALSGPLGEVTIRREPEGGYATIEFGQLRRLAFPDLIRAASEVHPVAQHGAQVSAAGAPQRFQIVYRDGKTADGETYGSVVDEFGLHLFEAGTAERLNRLFVPHRVIERHTIGPLLGEALLAAKLISEADLERGVEAQRLRQERRAEEYLKEVNVVLSAEELAHTLRRQSSYTPAAGSERPWNKHPVTKGQLQQILRRHQAAPDTKLGAVLTDMGITSAESVYLALAHKLGLPFVKLRDFDLDTNVLSYVTNELARKLSLIPLLLHEGHLVVAVSDPTDVEDMALLRFVTGLNLDMAVASKEDIEWAIDRYYGMQEQQAAIEDLGIDQAKTDPAEAERRTMEQLGKEKPIVKMVDRIILDAIHRRASDIHIRPAEDNVELLYRIDGQLIPMRNFSKALLPAVVSRIKIIGHMDIAERRLPQDGRMRMADNAVVVDLRISVMPTVEGESVVIRLLNTATGLKSVTELGLSELDQDAFSDLLHKSYGLILVTGPTGSGKSTTLYAALGEIMKQNVNIITVEDPVEYHIAGIEQMQVHASIGFTFARALRNILRHDPDVVMVGEIRDQETAQIAIESALTGHLVLSTLHTNNAAGAINRLMEMGAEGYLLTSSLLAVMAQRLIRRNCPHCITEEAVEPGVRKLLGVPEDEAFYHGTGCEECNRTGYSGRLAVYELLLVTGQLRPLIARGASADEIHEQATKDGMVPLTDNALARARQRETSLAEVYRVRLE